MSVAKVQASEKTRRMQLKIKAFSQINFTFELLFLPKSPIVGGKTRRVVDTSLTSLLALSAHIKFVIGLLLSQHFVLVSDWKTNNTGQWELDKPFDLVSLLLKQHKGTRKVLMLLNIIASLEQKSSIYQKIHIIKIFFFTKFTFSKCHFSKNSW